MVKERGPRPGDRMGAAPPMMTRHLPEPEWPSFWPIAIGLLLWSLGVSTLWYKLGLSTAFGWVIARALFGCFLGYLVMRWRWARWRRTVPTPEEMSRQMREGYMRANRENSHLN